MTFLRPFIIFCLPRSRSAWVAHFLNYGGRCKVGHDIVIECKKVEDFFSAYKEGMRGTVETGAVEGWPLFHERFPEGRILTIHRPLAKVKASLARYGVVPQEGELEAREEALLALSRMPFVESLVDSDLDLMGCCRWLFEYTTGLPWDQGWWEQLRRINIQVDMAKRLEQLHRNHEQLEALKAEFREGRRS